METNMQSYTHNIDTKISNNTSTNATIIIDTSVDVYAIGTFSWNI